MRLIKISKINILFINITAISSSNYFIPRSSQSLYSSFRCYGNESSLMNCLYSSSSCTLSYRRDAAVRCGGDIAGIKVEIIISTFSSQQLVVLTMVIFVWLVPVVPTQLKGEWSTAITICGEPF